MEAFRFIDRNYDVPKAAEAVAFLLQRHQEPLLAATVQTVICAADHAHLQLYGKQITNDVWQGEAAGINLKTLLYQFGVYSDVPAWRKLISRDGPDHVALLPSTQLLEFPLLCQNEKEILEEASRIDQSDVLGAIEHQLGELRHIAASNGRGNLAMKLEAARLEANNQIKIKRSEIFLQG